jgi:hypothetical protein
MGGRARPDVALAAILGVGLALRLAAVLLLPVDAGWPDSEQFLGIAGSLLAGQGFCLPNGEYQHARPPLYPLFLAAGRMAGESLRIPLIAQAVLDTLTAFLVAVLGRGLGLPPRTARVAALLYAVNPYAVQFARLVLSECLGGVLLIGGLAAWGSLVARGSGGGDDEGRSSARGRGLRAALSGALLGLACLTRPTSLGAAAIALVVLAALGRGTRAERLRVVAALAAGAVLVMAPWVHRNRGVYGRLVASAPTSGWVLYESFNPEADGGPMAPGHRYPKLDGTFAERDSALAALGWKWIRENRERAVALAWEKQKRFWNPLPNFERFRTFPYVLAGAYELPLIGLSIAGLVLAAAGGPGSALFPLVPVTLYFPALHLVYLGSVRYRMPIEPLLALFAAAAGARLFAPRAAAGPGPNTSERS